MDVPFPSLTDAGRHDAAASRDGPPVLAAFRLRAQRALFAQPLDPVDDFKQFGCHAIAGHHIDPAILANPRPAAVLVPVVPRPDGLAVMLTERASHLNVHAGQVAFPGGRIEQGETPRAAALREAEEEIGLDPALVAPLGYLPPYFTGTGFRIQPMVGLVSPDAVISPDANEVARVFEVPLARVLDTNAYREGTIFFRGAERRFLVLDHPDAYIWGVTAGIMRALAERY